MRQLSWLKSPVGLRFHRIRPDKNGFRFYVLLLGPTLWGTWARVRRWGRLGTKRPHEHITEFTMPAEAETEFRAQAACRAKRGHTSSRECE